MPGTFVLTACYERTLRHVNLAVGPLAEARLPGAVALGWVVGRSYLFLDRLTDAVSVLSLVGQHDGARTEMVEQRVSGLTICACPAVRPSRIGSPCASTTAWIFVVRPPRERPKQ